MISLLRRDPDMCYFYTKNPYNYPIVVELNVNSNTVTMNCVSISESWFNGGQQLIQIK